MSGSSERDLRLVPAAVAAWAGTWAATSGEIAVVAGAGAAAIVVAIVASARRSARIGLVAVVLAGSTIAGVVRIEALIDGPIARLASQKAVTELVLTVSAEPSRFQSRLGWGDQVRVRGDVLEVDGRGQAWAVRQPVVVEASGDRVDGWDALPVGATVSFSGRLGVAEVSDGVAAVVRALGPPHVVSGPLWWLAAVETVRQGLRAASADLTGDQRALVPALTLGDTSQVSSPMTERFRATGLTHLMAVSGANLALLLSFVMLVARRAGVRGRWLTVVGLATVAVFVALCRAEPSVLRAAAMGLVALAAVGREAGSGGGLRLVSVAVVGLCWLDPWLSRSWGFGLSVAACLGIVWWGPQWTRAIGRWLPGWLAEAVAVPLAAQVATQPLVTALSGQVSVVGVPANAAAGPFVGPATVLGFAASGVAWWWPWAGRLVAWAAGWAAQPILWIAAWGASLPGATVAWPATMPGLVLVTIGAVSLGIVTPWALRRWWVVLPAALALVAALLWAPYHAGWPPTSWQVVACDVGQGDATVVWAAEHQAVVVDTGPDPGKLLACLDQLGVDAVPLLVLTHYHADHTGGVHELLASRPVGRVLVSPVSSPTVTAASIARDLEERGIPLTVAATGQVFTVGAAAWQTVAVDGTGAAGAADEGESSAENNSSIVGRLSVGGVSILVTGDLEPEGQQAALAAGADVRAMVLKVPHHGSSRQDPDFLAATRARIALLEVGLDNSYGHPAAKTLRTLEADGMQVVRTDQQGAVAISHDPAGWRVVTLR